MRLSTGGCYGISGIELRRVSEVSPGPGAAESWRNRQADLWAESSSIIHLHHKLTTEELGLWEAMQKELDYIGRELLVLERAAMRRRPAGH